MPVLYRYTVRTLNADGVPKLRIVRIKWRDEQQSEDNETNSYANCRERVQEWLNLYWEGDALCDDGCVIELLGGGRDSPEDEQIIDMTTEQ